MIKRTNSWLEAEDLAEAGWILVSVTSTITKDRDDCYVIDDWYYFRK